MDDLTITQGTQEQGRLVSVKWDRERCYLKVENDYKPFVNITADLALKEKLENHVGDYIRIYGAGTYTRHKGPLMIGWFMDSFKVADFVELNDESLVEAVSKLREAVSNSPSPKQPKE